jgi:hypothetical protein
MNNGTTTKRCGCRHPDTGKPLGSKCPKLRRGTGWNPNHDIWQYQIELPARAEGRRRPLRRSGFATQTDAADALRKIKEALAVCAPGDTEDLIRVGDLIEAAGNAQQPVPSAAWTPFATGNGPSLINPSAISAVRAIRPSALTISNTRWSRRSTTAAKSEPVVVASTSRKVSRLASSHA